MRLFGTDGVRGIAGEFLTADLALGLGRAAGDYVRELELRFRDLDLSGRRILLDCANGATYRVAPEIFRRLGATVDALATEPNGRNINEGVGSTHIDVLAEAVPGGGF